MELGKVSEAVERKRSMLAASARVALAGLFHIGVRATYSVELRGLEDDECAQHTYYALARKRDVDPLILLPPLLRHRGWQALSGGVRVALRADAFTPRATPSPASSPLPSSAAWFTARRPAAGCRSRTISRSTSTPARPHMPASRSRMPGTSCWTCSARSHEYPLLPARYQTIRWMAG